MVQHPQRHGLLRSWWATRLTPTNDAHLKNLLEVPWAEYMAFKGELQAKKPLWAAYGRAYKAAETTELAY